jgi:hypothetical protein
MTGPPAPVSSSPTRRQDQRAHDPLAELRFSDEQCTQSFRWNEQSLDRDLCGSIDKRRPAGELRQLTHELTRSVRDNQFAAAGFGMLGYLDTANKDDHEAKAHLTDLRERRARVKAANLTEPAHPLDLRRLQGRKHLGASGGNNRFRRR